MGIDSTLVIAIAAVVFCVVLGIGGTYWWLTHQKIKFELIKTNDGGIYIRIDGFNGNLEQFHENYPDYNSGNMITFEGRQYLVKDIETQLGHNSLLLLKRFLKVYVQPVEADDMQDVTVERNVLEESKKTDNVFLGIIGAFIGAGIGSVLWILIGQFGFIAGIAGYAIVYGSVKGYKLLGKSVTRKGIIICVCFSLFMIFAAEYVSTGITIYQELKSDYWITLTDSMRLVPEFLKEPEVRTELLKELAIGYGLAIWASYSFVKDIWKKGR